MKDDSVEIKEKVKNYVHAGSYMSKMKKSRMILLSSKRDTLIRWDLWY